MDRNRALTELAQRAEALRARGAAAAYLFGSTARREARPESDLDIFIDVQPNRKFSLLDLIAIKHFWRTNCARPLTSRREAASTPS